MTNYLKKLDFKRNNINDINEALNSTREALINEISDTRSMYNEDTKFQLKRIIDTIDRKNILTMPVGKIETYIKDLIVVIDFAIGEY